MSGSIISQKLLKPSEPIDKMDVAFNTLAGFTTSAYSEVFASGDLAGIALAATVWAAAEQFMIQEIIHISTGVK
jgi:hypothetical protein